MATQQSIMAVIRAARPFFGTPYDKVAFVVHAAFVAAGYLLHATGPSAFVDDALSSSADDEVGIDHWNEVEDVYAFVYSNPEKDAKKVLMKCLVMNEKLLVDVLKECDSNPLHLEVDVEEYVEDSGRTNYGSQFKNLGKLVADIKKEILGKLDGSLTSGSPSQFSSSETRNKESGLRIGVDDREDPYASPYPVYIVPPPMPYSGGSDLFPAPGAGIYTSRGYLGGRSLLLGPNDPWFLGPWFDPYGSPGPWHTQD